MKQLKLKLKMKQNSINVTLFHILSKFFIV